MDAAVARVDGSAPPGTGGLPGRDIGTGRKDTDGTGTHSGDRHVAEPVSGLRLARGRFTALVTVPSDEATTIAYRLARLDADLPAPGHPAPPAVLDGRPVDTLTVAELRRRVLVSEAEPRLFSGTLRAAVDPSGTRPDVDVHAALDVADARDVLEALPDGLDDAVQEGGRSLSGGQRQRIALARAVLADPEVLVLVDPTSAVDAHTEARIAARLADARRGRTTLVTTTSPLVLDRADVVAFAEAGRIVAEGRHGELLRSVPAYRGTVARGRV